MTDEEYTICETQADIFSIAADEGYDMERFAEKFMTSEFCSRSFDTEYSRYQFADARESWDNFDFLSSLKKYDHAFFDHSVAGWIGFTYRQLWYQSGMPSRKIYERLPFKEMLDLYPAYHTMDEEIAAETLTDLYLKRKGKNRHQSAHAHCHVTGKSIV